MSAVAVTVFDVEPIWNSVRGVTGNGFSTFVMPTPPTYITPSCSTPIAAPGTW